MVTEEVKLLKTLVSDLEKELKTKGNRKRFFIRVAFKNDLQKTYGIFQMLVSCKIPYVFCRSFLNASLIQRNENN